MNISESRRDGITILKVAGRLDVATAAGAEGRILEEIEKGAERIVVDLAGVDYISSAGLRALLTSAKRAQQAKGRMALADASPQVADVLEMAGFAAIIPVFGTVELACGSLAPAGPSAPPSVSGPLTFAEEIYLLALDDREGVVKPMPAFALDYALAGALLMELALDNRVDSDLAVLKVVSGDDTGVALLDETLRELRASPEPRPTSFWLKQLADESKRIEKRVLESLVSKGVLRQENRRILWVFEVRRYPVVDNREVKEVRGRLRDLVLGDEIPAPRDLVLVCLGNACRLLDDLFTEEELDRVRPRMAALSRLDLIGHEMYDAIREIERSMAVMSMPVM